MNAAEMIQTFIENSPFPCVGAKTAQSKKLVSHCVAGSLDCHKNDGKILKELRDFIEGYDPKSGPFGTFICVFPDSPALTEEEFEAAMWKRLQALHDLDPYGWDPTVSSDPADNAFSFSLLGKAFYIVGLHPGSSRKARQFPMPALVFNLHEQFELLRSSGKYQTMRQIIRRRDQAYSGSINPMLENFGASSEARQYSGRATAENWQCPFHAKAKENVH